MHYDGPTAQNSKIKLPAIDDKRELIKSLEQYYYSDFKQILRQFAEGNFDEAIIPGSEFDNFSSIVPEKLQKLEEELQATSQL